MNLLRRTRSTTNNDGVTTYLLIPDINNKEHYEEMFRAVLLANCWRIRRNKPYVIANIGDQINIRKFQNEDREYAFSLPQIINSASRSGIILNVGQGDISPFVPRSEDGYLLFLPNPLCGDVPDWPFIITELNSVLVTICDEFINVQTMDTDLINVIDLLPEL